MDGEVFIKGVPPQVGQVPQGEKVPIGNQVNEVPVVPLDITNEEVIWALLTRDRALKTLENKDMGPRVNALESTMTSKLKDFVWMNSHTFLLSKVGEFPQEFLDEVYKIVHDIVVSSREKAELVHTIERYCSSVIHTMEIQYANLIVSYRLERVYKSILCGVLSP